jgi:C-terminal processing protease CtpA/Prc
MLTYAEPGMAIDSRDWGVVSVLPHSLAEKSGLTAGSIVLKVNGLKKKNTLLKKQKELKPQTLVAAGSIVLD